MFKLRKNKKGEDMLVDFWAILIFAFILIIFFIMFLVDKRGDAPSTVNFEDKDLSFMLNSFIRAPYAKDDTKTIGEIIAEDSISNDFTRTKEIFKSYFSGVDTYKNNPVIDYQLYVESLMELNINNPKAKTAIYNQKKTVYTTTKIPLPDGTEITIKLTVDYWPGDKTFK
jgi:hypothetical protein